MVIHLQAKYQKSFSASKTDRNEISTVIPMFSGFGNTVVISRMMLDINESRKFKMAAGKPEILISQLPDEIENVISKARSRVSELRNSVEPMRILPDVTGSQKFNMAATKPEVLISRLPDEIET